MVKAVVLYGPPEDQDAFERYYADTHTALATAIPGLLRFEAARAVATPDGSELPYQRIAELTFEDVEALQATRALLLVRGAGDTLEHPMAPLSPSFRIHTFFRSIEGLFAPVGDLCGVSAEWRSAGRRASIPAGRSSSLA